MLLVAVRIATCRESRLKLVYRVHKWELIMHLLMLEALHTQRRELVWPLIKVDLIKVVRLLLPQPMPALVAFLQ